MTSLKTNMIAGYAAQIYTALAGIVMLPFYLHYMGDEAYGLVAIFVMLQGWLLLDLGLSPIMAREMAQFRAGAVGSHEVRRLLHRLEAMFAGVAAIVAVAMIAGARWLATHWLRLEHLPIITAETSLMLMAAALALRLFGVEQRGRQDVEDDPERRLLVGILPVRPGSGRSPRPAACSPCRRRSRDRGPRRGS